MNQSSPESKVLKSFLRFSFVEVKRSRSVGAIEPNSQGIDFMEALQIPLLYEALLEYATRIHCEECISLYGEIQAFKGIQTPRRRGKTALTIYEKYLKPQAEFEANISEVQRLSFEENCNEEPNSDLFYDIETEMLSAISEIYKKFLEQRPLITQTVRRKLSK